MEPHTVDAIVALLDCLRESNQRSGLIIMDMMMQAQMDRSMILAGVITFVGLLVVKALLSSRLDRSARVAGIAATVVLIVVVSVKAPDWPPASTRHDVADKASEARIQLADTQCPEAPLDEER